MNDRRMDQNRKERILRGLTVLTAGVLAGVMYLLLIRHNAIVPFGDNTWIMLDLKRQYIDYYAYYQRIFSGQEGILYSFETTLGSGMVGFMCSIWPTRFSCCFCRFRQTACLLAFLLSSE